MKTLKMLVTMLFLTTAVTVNAQTRQADLQHAGELIKQGRHAEALAICDKYPEDATANIVKYLSYTEQKDVKSAFKYAYKAACKGMPFAMQIVALAYSSDGSFGCEPDAVQAIYWFSHCAVSPENDLMFLTALIYIAHNYALLGYYDTAAYWLKQYDSFYPQTDTVTKDALTTRLAILDEELLQTARTKGNPTKSTFTTQECVLQYKQQ